MITSMHRYEIENTIHRWALGVDDRDIDMLSQCLADNAELSILVRGGDLIGPFVGREAILDLVYATWHHQDDRRRHLLSNIIIDCDEHRATASAYLTIVSISDGVVRILSTAQCRDELSQCDGGWKIAKRLLNLDLPY